MPAWDYVEQQGPRKGTSPFPHSIRLRHIDIPDEEPYKLEPLPGYILLLPQSYFGLNVDQKDRFVSLVPPLPASNADILVPKYHSFLEGLVHFIMKPPTGLLNELRPHYKGRLKHDIFLGYLLSWRVRYDYDVPLPTHELLPEEEKILAELQTDEARWYIHHLFWQRKFASFDQMIRYTRQKQPDETAGTFGHTGTTGNVEISTAAKPLTTHAASSQGHM
ncbi:hypothetical protein FKP32DRAFT_1677103 [Trametes sanguinea]|nr:hypothetical protein FKP32DRAFT_1677103 [Trametes sanguinea]